MFDLFAVFEVLFISEIFFMGLWRIQPQSRFTCFNQFCYKAIAKGDEFYGFRLFCYLMREFIFRTELQFHYKNEERKKKK